MAVTLDLGSSPPVREAIDSAYAEGERQGCLALGARYLRKATGASSELADLMVGALTNEQIDELLASILEHRRHGSPSTA